MFSFLTLNKLTSFISKKTRHPEERPDNPLFQEWQSSLYSLLQNQTFNQVEVDLFELMCKVLDQNLFAQVDWARNSYYFKELKVGTNSAPFK